jgi:uncharacterized protein (TIGR02996 family)
MREEESFLRAILASPEDLALRLVYADWLEERGDPRAEFLRVQVECKQRGSTRRVTQRFQAQLQAIRPVYPGWLAYVQTFGVPFQRRYFGCPPADLPFTQPLGLRGRLVTFDFQFRDEAAFDQGLIHDVHFLSELGLGNCYYGAADFPVQPFLCEFRPDPPLTGASVLAGLKARHFRSEHIHTLDASDIPFPGYHAHTENDEIHNDFSEQYLFEQGAGEWAGSHGALKRYVDSEQVWYVLLHPTRHGGFCNDVFLFAVGRSLHGKRLVGVMTQQMCHNLCD